MNNQQVIYAVILAALWATKSDRYLMAWLTFNLFATLCAAGLMDIGVLDRKEATSTMMIVDLATGSGLAVRAGLSRVVSLGYAVTVPLYSLNLVFGVQPKEMFAVIFAIAFLQLGVVTLGTFGGGGGHRSNGGRLHSAFNSFLLPRGINGFSVAHFGRDTRGRLNQFFGGLYRGN